MAATPNLQPDQFYELGEPETQHVRRFNTTAVTHHLTFRNIENAEIFFELLPALFDHAIDKILEGALDTDYVGAELLHPSLNKPVLLTFRRRSDVHGHELLHILERVMQSKDRLILGDGQLQLKLVKVSPPNPILHNMDR